MVGHKLGEFSPTRLFRGHSGKAVDKKAAGVPVASGPGAKPAGGGGGR
jgi:Ribosomal protein S19